MHENPVASAVSTLGHLEEGHQRVCRLRRPAPVRVDRMDHGGDGCHRDRGAPVVRTDLENLGAARELGEPLALRLSDALRISSAKIDSASSEAYAETAALSTMAITDVLCRIVVARAGAARARA